MDELTFPPWSCRVCGLPVVPLFGQYLLFDGPEPWPAPGPGPAHFHCVPGDALLPWASRWRADDPGTTVWRTPEVEVVSTPIQRRVTVYGAWGRIAAAPSEWPVRLWVRGVVRLTRRHRLDLDLGGYPEVAARLDQDFAARRPWTVPQLLEAVGAPRAHPEVLDRSVISTSRPESPCTGTVFHLHAVYDEHVPRVADDALRRALES